MHDTPLRRLHATGPIKDLLAAAALALTIVGCSAGSGGPAVPTAPGSFTAASPGSGGAQVSPGASLDPNDAMLAFARCMRQHGVDMPDPQAQSGGGMAIELTGDATSQTVKVASKACEPLMPKLPPAADGKASQEFADRALKMARCMREHGIDMPDPQIQDGGTVSIGAVGFDPGSTKFKDAAKACGMSDGAGITVAGGAAGSNPGVQP